MDLADSVRQGVTALKKRQWERAARLLAPGAESAELSEAPDLQDVRARVLSLYAQALLELGRITEADTACRGSIRILRRLRDREGLLAVRGLQDRIVKTMAHDRELATREATAAHIRATPLETLLRTAPAEETPAEIMVKKANAHLDEAEQALSAPIAREAFKLASADDAPVWQVYALIALARAVPEEAERRLIQALEIARASQEFNLVSTIAETARWLGVPLPVEYGPHRKRSP